MKKCNTCKKKKDSTFFYDNQNTKDKKSNRCKDCQRVLNDAYNKKYQNNKSNPVNSTTYRKAASLKFRTNNFELQMLLAIKSKAKKEKRNFDLTIEDIIIPKNCPYLNIPITKYIGSGRHDSNPSVDRINNELDYIKGNIQIVSNLANLMKRNATIEQLRTFAQNVLKIH